MMVPKAVGVLVLGLDSPISPVVMTARLQDPATLQNQDSPVQNIQQTGKKLQFILI